MGYILWEAAEESASLKAKFVAVQQLLIKKNMRFINSSILYIC